MLAQNEVEIKKAAPKSKEDLAKLRKEMMKRKKVSIVNIIEQH